MVMNTIDNLLESESVSLYLMHLMEKTRASRNRKLRLTKHKYDGPKTHWPNHAGSYKDDEMKIPKYWNRKAPVAPHNPIKSYQDLSTAIGLILSGDRNYSDYSGVAGINRERLRLAQSSRDRAIGYDASDIVKMCYKQIRQVMSHKPVFGIVYVT